MRQVKIGLLNTDLAKIESGTTMVFDTIDSTGRKWKGTLARVESGYALIFDELPVWSIAVEGVVVGNATHLDPGEAVREAFQSAGLTSLPEAVEVRAFTDGGEIWCVFTLDGKAYQVPHKQFVAEVMNTSRWQNARQAKRHEIDALRQELAKMVKKP